MEVKNSSQPLTSAVSPLWLIYFLITIGLFGFVFGFFFWIPLYLVASQFPAAGRAADTIMQVGIKVMLTLQPWLKADFQIQAIEGLHLVPSGHLLVSNHRSHLDVFLFLSRVRGVRILASERLFRIPFLGLFMRLSGQILVPQGELDGFFRALRQVQEKLRSEQSVLIFPELTRAKSGQSGTLPFSTAPFRIAQQENVMVFPVVIKGSGDVWPKGKWGLSFRKPVTIQALTPIRAHEFPDAESLCKEVRTRISESLLL